MKKRVIGGAVVGVLMLALLAGGAWAQQGPHSQEPVQTRTQTRTMETTGECPEEAVAVQATVERQLFQGRQGRMQRMQSQLFGN